MKSLKDMFDENHDRELTDNFILIATHFKIIHEIKQAKPSKLRSFSIWFALTCEITWKDENCHSAKMFFNPLIRNYTFDSLIQMMSILVALTNFKKLEAFSHHCDKKLSKIRS